MVTKLSQLVMVALVGLTGVNVAAAAPFVYVANADGNSITVIDAATNTVATTVPVGSEPRNPAVSPGGARVYVPNRFDDNVTVIDGTINMVLTTIDDTGFDEPYGAAVSPSGALVYVVNKEGGGSSTGSLTVINATNNTVVTTVDDPCFVSPEWVIFNPAGTRAYVVSRQGDNVCVVNTSTHAVLESIPVGSAPRSAVVTCDGAYVYVANNSGSPSISKIQTSNGAVTGIDFMGGAARNLAITPDCTKIFVPLQDDSVGVIATANDATTTIPIPGGDRMYGAAVIRNGARVYVTDEDDDEVEVIDVATNTVLSGPGLPIPAGFTPRGIATEWQTQQAPQPVPALGPTALMLAGLALLIGGVMVTIRRQGRAAS